VEKGQSTYGKIKEEQGCTWQNMQAESKRRGTALKAGQEACGGTRNASGTAPHLDAATRQTAGWRPTCDHEAELVPSRVLDPFAGSGTVGVVAQKLKRNAVLLDAKQEYCEMAMQRCGLFDKEKED